MPSAARALRRRECFQLGLALEQIWGRGPLATHRSGKGFGASIIEQPVVWFVWVGCHALRSNDPARRRRRPRPARSPPRARARARSRSSPSSCASSSRTRSPIAVGFLSGVPAPGPRRRRLLDDLRRSSASPRPEPSLTVAELDRAIAEIQAGDGKRIGGQARGRSSTTCSAAPPSRRPTSSSASSRASCGRARSPG